LPTSSPLGVNTVVPSFSSIFKLLFIKSGELT
jgi:hypothetical protein